MLQIITGLFLLLLGLSPIIFFIWIYWGDDDITIFGDKINIDVKIVTTKQKKKPNKKRNKEVDKILKKLDNGDKLTKEEIKLIGKKL